MSQCISAPEDSEVCVDQEGTGLDAIFNEVGDFLSKCAETTSATEVEHLSPIDSTPEYISTFDKKRSRMDSHLESSDSHRRCLLQANDTENSWNYEIA